MFKTPRAAVLLVFGAFGSVVGSHVGALPVILKAAGVDPEFFGRTQAFAMLSALAAMGLGGYLSRHFSHRLVMLVALPAIFLALLYALSVRTPVAYLISNVVLAGSLSFLDLNMNAEGAEIEREVKRPIYTTFHASVSLMFAAAVMLSSYVSVKVSVWAPSVLAALLVAAAFLAVHRQVPARLPHKEQTRDVQSRLPYKPLTLIGFTIGLSNSCEITAMLWAGQLLAELAPDLLAFSGLGAAFFGLCGGLMRLVGDDIRARIGVIRTMSVSLALATLGFAAIGAGMGFAASALAFALVGAGLALVFPGLFSLAGQQAPERRAAAMGYASVVSGGPRFVVPWLLGLIASLYSVQMVFAVCAVLTCAAVLIINLRIAAYAHKDTGTADSVAKPMTKGASSR